MKNALKLAAFLISLALTPGCFFAVPAGMNNMTVATPKTADQCATGSLQNNVNVKDVSGGEPTYFFLHSEIGNTEFRGALASSLMQAGLLEKQVGAGRYLMSARIVTVEQGLVGLLGSMKVKMSVRYDVVDKTSESNIFSESILTEYTATGLDNLIGVYRMQEANEGSARENIRKLIEKLLKLNVSLGSVTIQ